MRLIVLLSIALVGLGPARAQGFHWTVFGGFSTNNNPNPQIPFGILPPSPIDPSTNLGASNTLAVGGQAEWRFGQWWGAGLDLAGIFPLGGKVLNTTIGTLSPNLYAHMAKSPFGWLDPGKVDLYATGGYTVLFQQFGANGFNVGGGANFWRETNGMMIEFRYVREVGSNAPVTGSPYYEVRVGWIHR